MAGFAAGARLLLALVERYWDTVHPVIDEGDAESRVAPFIWMNETMPLTLRLHVPLMRIDDLKPPMLNLADWEQITSAGAARERENEGAGSGRPSRDELIAMADTRNLFALQDTVSRLKEAQEAWDALSRVLDERLAMEAPSLGKVAETLRKLERAAVALLDGRDPRARERPPVLQEVFQPEEAAAEPEKGYPMSDGNTPMTADVPASLPSGPISSRQEAYRMLEVAAAYLERTEPHSPTPYLVKRAVTWGQMSLADLMQEILREEGDLTRYFSLLGMNVPRD